MAEVTGGPAYVYVKIFDDCNAECLMCDCWKHTTPRLPVAHYRSILERLVLGGVAEARFTGGEPLLYRPLPELISQVARSGARASCITNGWLLPARADELIDAGATEIVVSLDAAGPLHDVIRGRSGLFDRCMRGAAAVRARGVPVGVNTVLQRSNIDVLPELASTLLDWDVAPAWWHLIPIRDEPGLRPEDEQIAGFLARIPALTELMARSGCRLVTHPRMFELSSAALNLCLVPHDIAYVDGWSGAVFGCNMLAYVDGSIGNLTTDSVDELWAGESARRLIMECGAGVHAGCGRCDHSSRSMNQLFIERARGLA